MSFTKATIWQERCLNPDTIIENRYRQIRHFEEYLYDNSYRVVKILLNVSKEKQKQRFLERIDLPEKTGNFPKAIWQSVLCGINTMMLMSVL